MIKHLFKKMMDEKHDFYTYMDMYETCTDPMAKPIIHTLAEQEAHHYKMIYDIVFKEDPNSHWTPMEYAMKDKATEWYEEMEKELKQKK